MAPQENKLSRREFLGLTGFVAAAAALVGCGKDKSPLLQPDLTLKPEEMTGPIDSWRAGYLTDLNTGEYFVLGKSTPLDGVAAAVGLVNDQLVIARDRYGFVEVDLKQLQKDGTTANSVARKALFLVDKTDYIGGVKANKPVTSAYIIRYDEKASKEPGISVFNLVDKNNQVFSSMSLSEQTVRGVKQKVMFIKHEGGDGDFMLMNINNNKASPTETPTSVPQSLFDAIMNLGVKPVQAADLPKITVTPIPTKIESTATVTIAPSLVPTRTPPPTETPLPTSTEVPEAGTQVFVRFYTRDRYGKLVTNEPDFLKQFTDNALNTEQWQQAQKESGIPLDQVLTINIPPNYKMKGVPAVIVGEIRDQNSPESTGHIVFATPVINEKSEITGTNYYIATMSFKQSAYHSFSQLKDEPVLSNWIKTGQIDESDFENAVNLVATSDGNLFKFIENNQEINKTVIIFFPGSASDAPIVNAFLNHKPFNTSEIYKDNNLIGPPPTILFLK
jgi:hypothetical protein